LLPRWARRGDGSGAACLRARVETRYSIPGLIKAARRLERGAF
jgi:hypothetical protein